MSRAGFITPVLVTPPTVTPVSLDELKAQLQVETSEHDAQLTALISSATGLVETWTNRSLVTRAYRGFLDHWPCDGRGWTRRSVDLPRAPLLGISAVTTYDDDDVGTAMGAGDYYIDTASVVGRLVLRRGATWPIPLRTANGIKLEWTAGYGAAATDVPPELRLGVLITAAWLFEQRGDEGSPVEPPMAAKALVEPLRIFAF